VRALLLRLTDRWSGFRSHPFLVAIIFFAIEMRNLFSASPEVET